MSWADRLLRFALGDPKREAVERLTVFLQHSAQQEQRLSAAAAQSPTAAGETELRRLAAARQALTTDLTQALQAREATVPAPPPPPPSNGVAHNHWARLVSALEAAQEMRAQLARETAHLLALDASLAGLIDGLDRGLHAESLSLRAMIARADPQALD